MDDFKTTCIYENLPIFAYFFKRREDFSRPFKKIQHFQISFHVPNTYLILKKKNAMCTFVSFCCIHLIVPVILTSIHHCVNNSPDIKELMMVIETETFNVDFTL